MSEINRATGLLVLEVVNSNPNGDPDRESDPRQRANGQGEISPVSVKRKQRDLVEAKDEPVFLSLKDRLQLEDGERPAAVFAGKAPDAEQVVFGKPRFADERSLVGGRDADADEDEDSDGEPDGSGGDPARAAAAADAALDARGEQSGRKDGQQREDEEEQRKADEGEDARGAVEYRPHHEKPRQPDKAENDASGAETSAKRIDRAENDCGNRRAEHRGKGEKGNDDGNRGAHDVEN